MHGHCRHEPFPQNLDANLPDALAVCPLASTADCNLILDMRGPGWDGLCCCPEWVPSASHIIAFHMRHCSSPTVAPAHWQALAYAAYRRSSSTVSWCKSLNQPALSQLAFHSLAAKPPQGMDRAFGCSHRIPACMCLHSAEARVEPAAMRCSACDSAGADSPLNVAICL